MTSIDKKFYDTMKKHLGFLKYAQENTNKGAPRYEEHKEYLESAIEKTSGYIREMEEKFPQETDPPLSIREGDWSISVYDVYNPEGKREWQCDVLRGDTDYCGSTFFIDGYENKMSVVEQVLNDLSSSIPSEKIKEEISALQRKLGLKEENNLTKFLSKEISQEKPTERSIKL